MILITGSTGMIGARLLFDLSKNERVKALRRASSSMDVVNRIFSADLDRLKNVDWVIGDVNDIYSLEDAFENVDVVYHSAAFISFRPSDREAMMKINVEGAANMVNIALDKKVKRFCHISSVAALGRIAGSEVVDENSVWKTSSENSNYAISKYGGEREVWRGIEEGLSAFIINPTIVIGPGDWYSGSAQMFSSVGKGLKFYTTGSTGFVDYRDVSKCAIELMNRGVAGKRFIVNADNLSYRFVFDAIAEQLKRPKATIRVTPFLAEIGWRLESLRSFIMRDKTMITKETARNGNMNWKYKNDRVKKEIGVEFIPIEEAVKHTAALYVK
ncbi:MAG: NAD-dependent epimerase/dehydratase family protein [Bacteroidia bacterium]|nr:NAD-dependent epimerase/dehydratase family protein [Bacteroidia bacterium]MBP9922408.1 NAD-dependent epimerase/dehydratase family protein [Bacteroidia bacterium]